MIWHEPTANPSSVEMIDEHNSSCSVSRVAEGLIERLEREYDLETGAIGLIRSGHLDEAAFARRLELLKECPSATDGPIDGHLVRLVWWMPWIAEWQVQRFEREGGDASAMQTAGNALFGETERILGVA